MFVPSLRIAERRERVALVARDGDRAGLKIRSNRNRGVAVRMESRARLGPHPEGSRFWGLGPSTKSALVSDVLGLSDSGSHSRPPTNAAGAQVR
jgi:hypothetical protein